MNYADRLLHILSNTWVSWPVRNDNKEDKQDSKVVETVVSLAINWISTTVMTLVVGLTIPDIRWLQYRLLFLLHPLAGLLLMLYYNYCHTWRSILTWKSKVRGVIIKKRPDFLDLELDFLHSDVGHNRSASV